MTQVTELATLSELSAAPEILARGTLDRTPIPEFLIHALDQAYEGTLVLQEPSGAKHAVYFQRGAPAKVRLGSGDVSLSDVLVDLGLVEAEVGKRVREQAEREGASLTELLSREHRVEDGALYVAQRDLVQRRTLRLCDLPPKTEFAFYTTNFLEKWGNEGPVRAKVLPLIWRALVEHTTGARVAGLAAKMRSHELRLRVEAPLSRYHLSSAEQTVTNLLRAKPQALSSLIDAGVGSRELVERVVVALLLSRQLQGLADDRDPVGLHELAESPNSVAPPSVEGARRASVISRAAWTPSVRSAIPGAVREPSAEQRELRQEIQRLKAQPTTTYYEALGLAPSADAAVIRAEFFRLAKRFHPDKLPLELADLRADVTHIFARMTEAHQVLTDSKRRAEYDARLKEAPDDEQAKVLEILEAVSAFQRAEVFLKKKDYARALEEAKKAVDGDPSQSDHLALYGHLIGLTSEHAERALPHLDQAVRLNESNVRALWYRGLLLKKLGRQAPALRDFRAIVEIRPQHVEAQREIRLHEMRRRTDPSGVPSERHGTSRHPRPEPPAKPGLFGRFLKK